MLQTFYVEGSFDHHHHLAEVRADLEALKLEDLSRADLLKVLGAPEGMFVVHVFFFPMFLFLIFKALSKVLKPVCVCLL